MPWVGIRFKKFPPYLIIVLILVAFSLRLQGNIFGLPYFFHPDEIKLTTPAWTMVEEGKWNPGNFYYPTGFIYLLLFSFKFISISGLNFHDYHADLIMLHWLGRFYSALLGAGTVILVYMIGKRLVGPPPGIIASIFLSLNFIHIKYSHYATPDVASLFFILLSLFILLQGTRKESLKQSQTVTVILAGFFGGIALGFKYSAWPIIFPLLIIAPKKAISTIFFYMLGFFLTTPFAFIDIRHFLSAITEVLVIPHSKWLGLTHPDPFYYFCEFKPIAGVGIIFIFSIIGLFSRLRNWSKHDTILISFFLPYTILTSVSIEKIDRFFLPAIIIFLLWAAISLDKTALILSRLRGKPYVILSALAIGLSAPPLLKSIRYVHALEEKDTRLRASEWIEKNIPPSSHIALFSHPWANPPLSNDGYKITSIPLIYKNKDRDREIFKLRIVRCKVMASLLKKITGQELSPELLQNRIDHLPALENFTLFPLSYFKEKGVEYIIISGFLKDDLLDRATVRYFSKLSRSASDFFREIEKETDLIYSLEGVKEFGQDYALGPSIAVYKLK